MKHKIKREENKPSEIVDVNKACQDAGDCCMAYFLSEIKVILDNLETRFIHLSDIARKISEIHTLHFPKDALEEKSKLTEKFLADIILGRPKKINSKRLCKNAWVT